MARSFAIIGLLATCVAAQTTSAQQTSQGPAALRIVVLKGEDAVNVIQQKTAVAPLIEVRDRNNLPVAGATVTFTVGPGATFGGASTLTVGTNAAGQAVATGLTPTAAGAIQVQATAIFQGQTALATIAQSNVLTAAQAAAATGSASGATTSGSAAGAQASQAGASVGAGGGLSTPAIVGIAGAAVAGGALAVFGAKDSSAAPTVSAVTATPNVALLGTDTPIVFAVQTSNSSGNVSYVWDFGDGSRATEQAPTHIYRVAGAFTARVTVTDANGSATGESVVNIRTLTGTWQSNVVEFNSIGAVQRTFTFSQEGANVSGSAAAATGPRGRFDACPIIGAVGAAAPRIALVIQRGCTGVINGLNSVFVQEVMNLDPGADGNTLTGMSGIYPITLRRQ